MKMKYKGFAVITDTEKFIKSHGSEGVSIHATEAGDWCRERLGWVDAGKVMFDININMDDILAVAKDKLEEKEIELKGKLEEIRIRKSELVALPAPTTEVEA